MSETTEAIPPGLCQCGCGLETALSQTSKNGTVRGQPNRFVLGHQSRGRAKRAPETRPQLGNPKGNPRQLAPSVVRPPCPTPECGETDPVEFRLPGWIFVLVAGSREPGRWFCCGQCATFGMAIAELRPAAEVAS